MEFLVSKKKGVNISGNFVIEIISAMAIYSMIIPLFIFSIWTWIYQELYFTLQDIPKVSIKDYVKFDRWDLKKLNHIQKMNCVYCEYANGVVSWGKAVAHQTEIYSCAIKHRHLVRGQLEENEKYFKYSEFE